MVDSILDYVTKNKIQATKESKRQAFNLPSLSSNNNDSSINKQSSTKKKDNSPLRIKDK